MDSNLSEIVTTRLTLTNENVGSFLKERVAIFSLLFDLKKKVKLRRGDYVWWVVYKFKKGRFVASISSEKSSLRLINQKNISQYQDVIRQTLTGSMNTSIDFTY
jgi:hypothetical protein